MRPKGQGARSCYCLTRGTILPYLHGNSVQLIGLEAVASPLARCPESDLDPVPLGQTEPGARRVALLKTEQGP